MSKFVYRELVVKNIIGLVTITQVFVLTFESQKPLFLSNVAKKSALKRLTTHNYEVGLSLWYGIVFQSTKHYIVLGDFQKSGYNNSNRTWIIDMI